MPRRLSDVKTLTVPCTEIEATVVDEMKRMCGLVSDADLVRTALWNFADHLDLDLPNTAFDLRPKTWPRPSKAPKTPSRSSPARAIVQGRRQAKTHPWAIANATHFAEHEAKRDDRP